MIEQIAESTGRTAVDTAVDVEDLLKDVPDCDRHAALEEIYSNSGSLDDDDFPSCSNCKFEDKCPLRSLLDSVSESFQFMLTEDWTPDAAEFCKCHEFVDSDVEDDVEESDDESDLEENEDDDSGDD